jgi:DNA-binding SARP family transcriptional activator/class 3 adenylate cyclase/predicted ATPase
VLSLRFLGQIRVERDGMLLALPPSRKTRALLAYLTLTGRPHRRDRLCSIFWEVPDDPRGALRWSLTKLRALVDEPSRIRILADREAVGLDPADADIDVLRVRERFQAGLESATPDQLSELAAGFRGELLEGLDLPDCLEFHTWLVAERQELKVQHCRLLHYLSAQLWARPAMALPYARALVHLDPDDETAWAMLVRLLAAAGRRDEAEQHYELGRRALAELGEPASGELERAKRELKQPSSVAFSSNPVIEPPPASSRLEAALAPILAPISPRPTIPVMPNAVAEARVSGVPQAERKHVTVLFAALDNLAARDGETDPEAVMLEFDPVLLVIRDIVQRYGGVISTMHSDGLTALFGAPIAHEDHALRACRAAIAMQQHLTGAMGGTPLLRIGLHSGEVIVRAGGDGPAAHVEAVGPVVSLVSRICALTSPGTTVLTEETARRADGFLQVQPLTVEPDVVGAPSQRLLRLLGTAGTRTRWEVRAARGLTPFLGRDAEMEALSKATTRVVAGHGEVVAIVADPGIGKSRLAHEFLHAALPASWRVLEASAAAEDARSAYRPVSALLRAWLGVEERDLNPEIEGKLRAKIEGQYPELRPALPALTSLLDLPTADEEWPGLSSPERRRRMQTAVKAVLACESGTKPLALLFEDLHWIDGETQAFLDTLVNGLGPIKLLLLVTYRPEYRHDWAGKSYFSQLRLLPLRTPEAEWLLRSLLGDDESLENLRRGLVERIEGTPLYAEETVRALAEAGAFSGQPGNYRLVRPLQMLEIPSTIQAVIAARIDRLAPASKSVLQAAAVIGRDVPFMLLKHVAGMAEDALRDELATLQAAEFLFETRLLPDVEYSFKHALTREVAYATVLRERRRELHVEIVCTIETVAHGRIDEQIERLAHHAIKGNLWEKAVRYLDRAASKAIQRSAHRQALTFLGQGLELIPKLADAHARLKIELDYQKAIGVATMAAKGWGAQEVSDAYLRARTLAEQLGDSRELFVVLRGQGQFHMIRGEVRIARELGERCIELARGADDPALEIETHHLFWSNSFFMGDYADAGHHSERGVALYDRQRDHRLTYVYSGHDPGVCCRCFSGLSLWQQGKAEQAMSRCQDALILARQVSHPLTLALAHWGMSYLHIFRREPAAAQREAEAEIAICEEYLLPLLLSQGRFQLGWALAAQGALREGIVLMQEGLEAISATGAEMGRPYFLALLAEALAKSGAPQEGLKGIEQALHIVENNQARFQLPEILRLKGEALMLLPSPNTEAAAESFRDAMAMARKQGVPLLELRAATSLARVLHRKGSRTEIRRLLVPIYRRCERMPESIDLREAHALLEWAPWGGQESCS